MHDDLGEELLLNGAADAEMDLNDKLSYDKLVIEAERIRSQAKLEKTMKNLSAQVNALTKKLEMESRQHEQALQPDTPVVTFADQNQEQPNAPMSREMETTGGGATTTEINRLPNTLPESNEHLQKEMAGMSAAVGKLISAIANIKTGGTATTTPVETAPPAATSINDIALNSLMTTTTNDISSNSIVSDIGGGSYNTPQPNVPNMQNNGHMSVAGTPNGHQIIGSMIAFGKKVGSSKSKKPITRNKVISKKVSKSSEHNKDVATVRSRLESINSASNSNITDLNSKQSEFVLNGIRKFSNPLHALTFSILLSKALKTIAKTHHLPVAVIRHKVPKTSTTATVAAAPLTTETDHKKYKVATNAAAVAAALASAASPAIPKSEKDNKEYGVESIATVVEPAPLSLVGPLSNTDPNTLSTEQTAQFAQTVEPGSGLHETPTPPLSPDASFLSSANIAADTAGAIGEQGLFVNPELTSYIDYLFEKSAQPSEHFDSLDDSPALNVDLDSSAAYYKGPGLHRLPTDEEEREEKLRQSHRFHSSDFLRDVYAEGDQKTGISLPNQHVGHAVGKEFFCCCSFVVTLRLDPDLLNFWLKILPTQNLYYLYQKIVTTNILLRIRMFTPL